jgi:iron complex outermembrane receptor protein
MTNVRRFALSLLSLCAALACAVRAEPSGDTADLEALLNQPVYAASKFAQDAADAPAAVTVLTAGDIRAYGWRTLGEVLNAVRGVHLRNDRFYLYAGVRGLARPGDYSSRLLVLVDGLRINDNIYDQAGVGREFPLDVSLIERVEFIPGPGSALYGSNAVLGVVNVVTRSGSAALGRSALVEIGSAGSRTLSLTLGQEIGAGRLLLSAKAETRPGRTLYYPEYDDAATNFGLTSSADRETDRKLFARWSAGEFIATAIVSERSKRIPTGAFDTIFPSTGTSGTDRYAFFDLNWQRVLPSGDQVFTRGGVAEYGFQGRFDYPAPDGTQTLAQRGRWASFEARWLTTRWATQRLMLGVEAQANLRQSQRSTFDLSGPAAEIEDRSRRFGLFANDEIVLTLGLRAVLGLRLDRQLDGTLATTPRIGVVWEARPGLLVKLLDGRAYREPNAFESQYEDNTIAVNPLLRSERLRATELAAEWRALPNLRVAASAYRYRVRNLIEQQLDETSGLLVFNNVGAVRAAGAELEADYVAAAGWRARASWASQSARDGQTEVRLSNSPTTLGKLHVSLPVPAWNARLGAELQHMGERLTVAGNRLPAQTVANLTAAVAAPGSPLSVSASVYNLFDRRVADPGGPELRQDQVPQDGRSWRLALTLQF